MTIEAMRRLHSARPFQEFDVYLADGRAVRIAHPELLLFSGGGRTIHLMNAGDFEIIDLLLVTSLRLVRRSAEAQNGH